MKRNEKLILFAMMGLMVLLLIAVIYFGNKINEMSETIEQLQSIVESRITNDTTEMGTTQSGIKSEPESIDKTAGGPVRIDTSIGSEPSVNNDNEDIIPEETETEVATQPESQTQSESESQSDDTEPETTAPESQNETEPEAPGDTPGETIETVPPITSGPGQSAPDNSFKYFALGNSITIHDTYESWFNRIGVAASDTQNDYVHIVVSALQERYGNVKFDRYNFAAWERKESERSSMLYLIEPFLSKDMDLVTVQLSDNVLNTNTFESDFTSLIRYIRAKCPQADIIVVDDFWDSRTKSTIKQNVCSREGLKFVSLSEIKGRAEYKCGIGTILYDANGGAHVCEDEVVADHPGDLGMKYIADGIIAAL